VTGLIAHEWIEPHGGAEKVLDTMAGAFPDADIACLWSDAPERYAGRRVTESRLARTPLRGRKALALPFMSRHWRNYDTTKYDWVLVSSHAFAHHAGSRRSKRDTPTFVYTHTPARYLWSPKLDERGSSLAARLGGGLLRRIDRRHAGGAQYAANSAFVRDRIQTAWGVDSRVIHPPVDIQRLQIPEAWRNRLGTDDAALLAGLPEGYLLGASRFVPYKALDRVIAFGEAVGRPVVLAGGGPDEERLRAVAAEAKVPVTFVHRPSDSLLYALIQEATAFVFPAIEDFGILPVEATALGTPVIVNHVGGAAESIRITNGGVVHDFSDAHHAQAALNRALEVDRVAAARASRRFSNEEFENNLQKWVKNP
jgi:glycosyltransferase involved in cell wall biosynthesis